MSFAHAIASTTAPHVAGVLDERAQTLRTAVLPCGTMNEGYDAMADGHGERDRRRSTVSDGGMTAERGLAEILTSKGIAEYLALVAILQNGMPKQFADRSWAYAGDRAAAGSPEWNAYRDRYAFCGMLGEWNAAGDSTAPHRIRQELFGFDVPVLRVTHSARDARRVVNEIVRGEMEALGISSQDATLGKFLRACFFVLGHVMTGAMDAGYFRQLASAQQICSASADPNLHALLRKQSALLWDTLTERSARTRRTTMRNILTEIEYLPC